MEYSEIYAKAKAGDANALKELTRYAEQGDDKAQYMLACLYEEEGELQDEAESYYWLDMAAYNGNWRAQAKQKQKRQYRKNVNNNESQDNDSKAEATKVDDQQLEKYFEQQEKSKKRATWIFRIVFLLFIIGYYTVRHINEEKQRAAMDASFKIHKEEEFFDPREHIKIDSNHKIRADKEYIEYLQRKVERYQAY